MTSGSTPTSGGPANAGGIGAMTGPQAAGQLGSAINGPQWLQGMQLGQQLSQQGNQMTQAGQRPMPMPQMAQRPPMMQGPAQGMQQGVVPGSIPQTPMGPGMASGGMGMPGAPNTGQQGAINPQLLQMLMRQQQR